MDCLVRVFVGALAVGATLSGNAGLPSITGEQRAQILELGPWPPAFRPDPDNAASGRAPAIELGRLLFRDARMSPVGYIGCVTCHQPDRAFTDAKARAHGLADLPRNTPALANLRQQRWYGWGGASDSLRQMAIRPIVDPREIGGSAASVRSLFVREPALTACYRAVFGVSPLARPQRTLANVGRALAAYVETLTSGRTPFDDFRDALASGDAMAAAAYPAEALRGLLLFLGAAGCSACHRGPSFSDGDFHPGAAPRASAELADAGRFDDLRRLSESRRGADAARLPAVTSALRDQFRTPGLRNVTVTAPYLHDGRADSLHEAVRHASVASGLAPSQVDDIVAFLHTLTDALGARRDWIPSEPDEHCR